MNNVTAAVSTLKANWAHLTPTFARLLDPTDVPGLEILALGGEAIGQDNVAKWTPYLRLMIAYGPTETCIDCSGSEARDGQSRADNLGYAVGCRMWITDFTNPDRLLPIGSIGEIIIDGPILARGYLNDPAKTESSFIYSPAWTKQLPDNANESRRFYRTGDLARYNDDGTMSFVTRKDGQIKGTSPCPAT